MTTIAIEGDVALMLADYRRARDARRMASDDEFAYRKAQEEYHAIMLAMVVSSAVDLAEDAGENPNKAVALATVAPAEKPKAGPGRGHEKQTDTMSERFSDPHSDGDAREAERLRAINRAPEPVNAAEGR